MPILGNLSEFPLPEVLLLIGTRTGRLRLLDVPEFGVMDIDFSEGEVHAMHIGKTTLTESQSMTAKLSAVVQAQAGMFEFKIHRIDSVSRAQPLMVNELVISLVCYVDEQIARQNMPDSPHNWYMLEFPQPEIWIEPELHEFFLKARHYLVTGVHCDDLAEKLKLKVPEVHKSLTNLRLLGLIKMVDGAETVQISEIDMEEQVARKSNEFLRAARAVHELKKITGRILAPKKPLEGDAAAAA